MKVVLEGPDNAGKTTLAKRVCQRAPWTAYHHPGGRPADEPAELRCMEDQLSMIVHSSNILVDRVTCVSQRVYNPDENLDPLRRSYAVKTLMLKEVVVVYCRPPNEVLMDVGNFTWRPEETEEHRQKIVTRAHEFVERDDAIMLDVPCVYYDFKDEAHAKLIEDKLVQAFNGHAESVQWFHGLINYRV